MAASVVLAFSACGGDDNDNGDDKVLNVAYGADYVFLSPELGKQWWNTVKQEFEQENPGAKVEFTPIPGGYEDIVTKLNLLYRNPDTAPDVAELPWGQFGSWVDSGYLLPLDDYLAGADWWEGFPESVRAETSADGTVYGVNHGENDTAIYYNKPMFQQAGIPVPWNPKTWNDIIAAAKKIKAAVPGVWPVWLQGGNAADTTALQYNGFNVIAGSSNPTIFDEETQKWVVDSPGLREGLEFYSTLAKEGLQAPAAELLDPNAVVNAIGLAAKQKMAIAINGNFFGSSWAKGTCSPCWPEGKDIMGVAPMPTVNGQDPGVASGLGGWELSIGADASNPDLAWEFIQVAQREKNMITASNQAGWVPPDQRLWDAPEFKDYAPPYQQFFANLLPSATLAPNISDYTVWATGYNQATGEIIQDPSTTVDEAIDMLQSYVTEQLGEDKVTTLD